MSAAETNSHFRNIESCRSDLICMLQDHDVDEVEITEILELAGDDDSALRRLAVRKRFGEPNAYLRGKATLMGRTFKIDRRSYIPDAYAEELVRRVISDAPKGAAVLEVGTGCGWIAITLKSERPDLYVSACDIDPNVLSLAAENANANKTSLTFHESYFVDDVDQLAPDIVIANIPYGGDANYTKRELEERPQMPPIALFDPKGPVVSFLEFVESIRRRHWRPRVYLETGYLARPLLDSVCEGCSHVEHVRNGEFGYLVLDLRT